MSVAYTSSPLGCLHRHVKLNVRKELFISPSKPGLFYPQPPPNLSCLGKWHHHLSCNKSQKLGVELDFISLMPHVQPRVSDSLKPQNRSPDYRLLSFSTACTLTQTTILSQSGSIALNPSSSISSCPLLRDLFKT